MTITTVKLISHNLYQIDEGRMVPGDAENKDYQEILAWVAEGNTIDESSIINNLKHDKIEEISSIRKSAQYAPISYKGHLIPNTEKAKNAIIAKILTWKTGASAEANKGFVDVLGQSFTLTKAEFVELARIIEEKETSLYVKEPVIIGEVLNITDKEELENFDVSERWNQE